MTHRFDELVDHPALRPEERERLRRVHDLLLEVGPPPEMPPRLRDAPEPPSPATVVPLRPRRRVLLAAAAALAAAAVGGAGYLVGERTAPDRAVEAVTATETATVVTTVTGSTDPPQGPLVSMTGVGAGRGASATVEILPRAASGDYPVRVRVRGLPERQTFELWVIDDGELEELCGSFTTGYGATDVVINVPYEMRTRDDWVLVRPGSTEPLLRTL